MHQLSVLKSEIYEEDKLYTAKDRKYKEKKKRKSGY